jgi:hypothetical protein
MQVSVFQLLEALHERQDSEIAAVATRREYWEAAAAMDALLAGHHIDAAETSMHTTRSAMREDL